jgi:hypothetical protein
MKHMDKNKLSVLHSDVCKGEVKFPSVTDGNEDDPVLKYNEILGEFVITGKCDTCGQKVFEIWECNPENNRVIKLKADPDTCEHPNINWQNNWHIAGCGETLEQNGTCPDCGEVFRDVYIHAVTINNRTQKEI